MNRQMNHKSGAARRPGKQRFTEKQGQYLAFIYAYLRMFRCSPAETDMQRHFQVSPPSVHQMVVTLERNGLIRRQPGVARSIELLVPPEEILILNGSKSTSQILCDEVLAREIYLNEPVQADGAVQPTFLACGRRSSPQRGNSNRPFERVRQRGTDRGDVSLAARTPTP